MIKSLHIENYALIEQLDIELHGGFSVVTGETGAGKSIILGAIGLLRGQRADTRAVKDGARRCVVEAVFDVSSYGLDAFFSANELDFDGRECVVRREITPAGKSRAFINDTPASLAVLKDLGDRLVDIHSQHQNLLLGREDFQLGVLDTVAGQAGRLSRYGLAYGQLREAERALEQAQEQMRRSKEEEDYLRFQFAQIEQLRLREGEQEELEAEARMLEHSEEIRQELFRAGESVRSSGDDEADVLQRLRLAASALRGVGPKFPPAAELSARIESCYIELKDVADELDSAAERVECDPRRLEQVHGRLGEIYALEQRHRVDSVEELVRIGEDLGRKLALIDHGDEELARLRRQRDVLRQQAGELAAELSDARRQAAADVERRMEESLRPLGMPNARFRVEVESDVSRLAPSGADTVAFLFSANKNGRLQNVADVASGGEIARVMLSLKALTASEANLPTIIFDEIDTGVSGGIAEKMARIMEEMGSGRRQVVSITHLPQIAARGRAHYKVYKEDGADATTSHVKALSPEERVEEIAHMLSGETLTDAALENARALLNMNLK